MAGRAEEPHPEAQAILDQVEALGAVPLSQFGVDGAREAFENFRPASAGPEVASVTDRDVPGPDGEIPVRIYRPVEEPRPTLVYFHGGGFVIGSVDSADPVARHLATAADCTVVSVEYRLAPEHPFPAPVEDAYAATEWLAENAGEVGGDGRLAVAGDSAGGTLAAVVALAARNRDGPEIDYQVLNYPATSPSDDWESRRENAEGYFLVEEDMAWFEDCYRRSWVDEANPYATPMNACDLSGLPPATVVSAGFDPLRDEDAAYADRMAEAGVPVEHRHYEDMIHGFVGMLEPPAELTRAHEAVAAVATDLNDAWDRE